MEAQPNGTAEAAAPPNPPNWLAANSLSELRELFWQDRGPGVETFEEWEQRLIKAHLTALAYLPCLEHFEADRDICGKVVTNFDHEEGLRVGFPHVSQEVFDWEVFMLMKEMLSWLPPRYSRHAACASNTGNLEFPRIEEAMHRLDATSIKRDGGEWLGPAKLAWQLHWLQPIFNYLTTNINRRAETEHNWRPTIVRPKDCNCSKSIRPHLLPKLVTD